MMHAKLAGLATVALALAIGGCSNWPSHHSESTTTSAEHRGPAQTVSDATITAKVKSKFAADETVKAHNINVDTVRGVVTLNGAVNSAAERDRALGLARSTEGVVDVKSNLRVGG